MHAGGGQSISQDVFKKDFEKLSVKAIAKLFLDVSVSGDGCYVVLDAETEVCQCVNKWKSCVEDGKVLGCCDDGYSCIKGKRAPDSRAKCRKDKALDRTNRKGVPRNVALEQTCGSH